MYNTYRLQDPSWAAPSGEARYKVLSQSECESDDLEMVETETRPRMDENKRIKGDISPEIRDALMSLSSSDEDE